MKDFIESNCIWIAPVLLILIVFAIMMIIKQADDKQDNKYWAQFLQFIKQDDSHKKDNSDTSTSSKKTDKTDQSNNDTWPVIWARVIKNLMQFAIGIGLFSLIGIELVQEFLGCKESSIGLFDSFINQPILKMVSVALAAATAIELAYMLFTPGPDEAVQPVMMGIASFILYALSYYPEKTKGIELIGIALLVLTIPLLFWTKRKFIDEKECEKEE